MKRFFVFSFLLTISIALSACDTSLKDYKPKNDDEKNIIALLNEHVDARNSADLERLQKTFHDDGVYISGAGGQFTKEKIVEIDPQLWLDNKVSLYSPVFKINGNEAIVNMTAKYFKGTFETPQIYTFVKENEKWLIMKVDG